ncbi:MaoC/PaaZ C-terminal domain-containing protein [Hydrogenophaga sp.]|uniref:MaoC family dehydratase n=1 Tax=Hydrogenophaga sp. TaxID=1904254 RepID=UPI00262E0B0F|nr:MaoC/PaaZ C-terminal domain-containing protein [Hydrogenophaga sp.]MCW5652132.1 MaoC family dehydratase N-terminal domain-containing protein [Hydrogenophaga sp.]
MSETTFPETLELRCGPVSAVDLALFAAASGDHNPLHLDAEVARAAGFERPVVHGMLSMAFAGRLFTTRWGPGALAHLQTRFTAAASLGDTITLRADREEVRKDGTARYRLQARNQAGTALIDGQALVRGQPLQ